MNAKVLAIVPGLFTANWAVAMPQSYLGVDTLAHSIGATVEELPPLSLRICDATFPQDVRKTLDRVETPLWKRLSATGRDEAVHAVRQLLEREGCARVLMLEDEAAQRFPGAYFLREGMRFAAVNDTIGDFRYEAAPIRQRKERAQALVGVLDPELRANVQACAEDHIDKRMRAVAYLLMEAADRQGGAFPDLDAFLGTYERALSTVCQYPDP